MPPTKHAPHRAAAARLQPQLLGNISGRYGEISYFLKDTGAAARSLIQYGEWAQNELDFLKQFISEGATVIDVGAFIGTHTLAFSQFVGSSGLVVAIEAQPETFALLSHNVRENGLANIRLEQAALADRVGVLAIPPIDVAEEDSFGSASLREVLVESGKGDPSSRFVTVPLATIDSLACPRCDLIKIDAEGVEHLVIEGGRETIGRSSPVIYAECNSVAGGLKCLEVLRGLGYEIWLHVVDAFNPENFRGAADNIFGTAREAALLAVPADRVRDVTGLAPRPRELILKIENADDLVLGMLNKAQYFEEVLRHSAAARSGGDAYLDALRELRIDFERTTNEANWAKQELAESRRRNDALQSWAKGELEQASEHYAALQDRLRNELRDAEAEATAVRAAAERAQVEAAALANELDAVRRSLSWRVTRPLRAARMALEAIRKRTT